MISSIQGNKLRIKERVFRSRRFRFKSNFDLLAAQLTPTSNEQMIIITLPTFLGEKILFLSMALFKLVASSSSSSLRLLWAILADAFRQSLLLIETPVSGYWSSTNSRLHKTLFFLPSIQTLNFYIPVSGQLQLWTPFSRPESVCSWELPLYLSHCVIYLGFSLPFKVNRARMQN